jgi:phosphonate transport system substrate-binding protein
LVEVSGEPIIFGVAPFATASVLKEELAPIDRYLEQEIGRPIEFVVANTYVDASTKLRDGEYDLGFMTPLLYVRTRRAEPNIRALAVREFDGAITSDGLLLILSDAKIQRLEDLRGETFCFTDKNSTTGNFLPRAHLRRRGWEPREFIGKVHWSGNHLQVLKDLEAGKCAAAATYSGSLLTADEHGLSVGRFRTLAITGHGPSDTMTARPGLPDELANQFQEAFLAFDPQKHSGTKAIGETLQITGFRKPQPELYESLEQAVEQNQDILERFGFPGVEEPSGTEGTSKDVGDAGDVGDVEDQ